MALQCTIIQKKEWYPDTVLGGPAENRHDSCTILEVVNNAWKTMDLFVTEHLMVALIFTSFVL
jgi:hypothetical protein